MVVGAAAWLLFGESLPPHRLIGIGLILSGVVLISSAPLQVAPDREQVARRVVAGGGAPVTQYTFGLLLVLISVVLEAGGRSALRLALTTTGTAAIPGA